MTVKTKRKKKRSYFLLVLIWMFLGVLPLSMVDSVLDTQGNNFEAVVSRRLHNRFNCSMNSSPWNRVHTVSFQ